MSGADMSCDELLRRLADYDDGALPKDLCASLESHLERCIPCADLRRDLIALSRLCRSAERPPMPAELRERLRALVNPRKAG
jgi:putative zinc finger protein